MATQSQQPKPPDLGEILAKIQQNKEAIQIIECSLNAVKQRVAKTKAEYEIDCSRFQKYSQILDENQQIVLIDAEFQRLQSSLYREQKLQDDFRHRVCTGDVDPINARVQFMNAIRSFCNYQGKLMEKLR